jgi:D-proline reductase (dithiol) PrdB
MPRLDRLSEMQRNSLLTHPCLLNDTAPWTRLTKPLAESTVAIVTTAGLQVRGDRHFTGGDQTFRVIPTATPDRDVIQSHTSIGFDRSGIYQDLNLVFPRDRLRELAAAGEIGGLGPNCYAFLGAQRTYDTLLNESGPAVAARLLDDGVDIVLLTGT